MRVTPGSRWSPGTWPRQGGSRFALALVGALASSSARPQPGQAALRVRFLAGDERDATSANLLECLLEPVPRA